MLSPTLRQGQIVIGLALSAVALYVLWEAVRMPIGSLSQPGAGFFPLGASALLLLVSLGLVLQAAVTRLSGERAALGHWNIAILTIATVAFALALEWAGFVLSAAGLLFVLLVRLSPLGWLGSAVAAAAGSVSAYLLFRQLLGVYLPAGLLAGIL